AKPVAASTILTYESMNYPKKATSERCMVDTRAARSRYLFPRSQEVSGRKEHAWQEAPCRVSPSPTGCSEQRGSDEQRRTFSKDLLICRLSLSGFPRAQRPPNVPSLSGADV